MPSWKKILLVLGFITIVIGLGTAIYTIFFKSDTPLPPTAEEQQPANIGEGLPGAGEGEPRTSTSQTTDKEKLEGAGEITRPDKIDPAEVVSEIARGGFVKTEEITQVPSEGVTLSGNGRDMNFYDEENGFFYRVDKNGKLVQLSDKKFFQVENIEWAPNKNETIMEFPDGSKLYFDFSTQRQVTLPSHWEEFSFSPNSSQVVFKNITDSADDNWLAISKPDGSEPQIIAPIGENGNKVKANWSPNDQIVATYEESKGLDNQEIYFLGKNDENFKLTEVQGRDFRPEWFPNGQKLLYSVYNTSDVFRPSLWVVDAVGNSIGNNLVKLPVNTWADRCTFNKTGSSIYCAQPKEMPEMAGLFPNLIEDQEIGSEIIKIDTTTGRVTKVGEPTFNSNISTIVVTDNEDTLFFQDNDQKIKKIQLK